MIFKNYLIQLNKNIIFYIENNNCFTYSISSIRKFRNNFYFFIGIMDNNIIINNSLFILNKIKLNNNFFYSKMKKTDYKLIKYFKECFYENKSKLKIVGRGWKIIKYNYQLLIKLGYSHMIFSNLSPILKSKIKKKKKKYYVFYGNSYNELSTTINKIKLMRVPNIYTKKGIFYNKLI